MGKDVRRLIDEQLGRSRVMRAMLEAAGPGEIIRERGPVITISRQLGSEGRLVAERLAERLEWSLWDKDLVDAIARDAYVSRKIAESFDERVISEIEVLARTIMGERELGGFLYGKHLARTLLVIAAHGNAIILGRGSNFLLTDALNIRLVASERYRIARVMERASVSREEALDRIRQSDRQRAAFVRGIYHRDLEDPLAYDVVIRMDEFEVEGGVEVILTALQSKRKEAESPGE